MNLRDTYRKFLPKTKEYTFFSAPQGTFSKTYLGAKQISTHIDHHRLKLGINNQNNGKLTNLQKLTFECKMGQDRN
jgi:exonuclease III